MLIAHFRDTKGQIISEKNCDVFNFPKKQQIIVRISAQASEMGQSKKKQGLFITLNGGLSKWYIITNLHDNVP